MPKSCHARYATKCNHITWCTSIDSLFYHWFTFVPGLQVSRENLVALYNLVYDTGRFRTADRVRRHIQSKPRVRMSNPSSRGSGGDDFALPLPVIRQSAPGAMQRQRNGRLNRYGTITSLNIRAQSYSRRHAHAHAHTSKHTYSHTHEHWHKHLHHHVRSSAWIGSLFKCA